MEDKNKRMHGGLLISAILVAVVIAISAYAALKVTSIDTGSSAKRSIETISDTLDGN